MQYFNSEIILSLNKKKSSRKKISFNRKPTKKNMIDYLLILVFLLSTTYCAFYG